MGRASTSGILIVGVGTADRGDDAAGLATLRLLKESGLHPLLLLDHAGDGAALLEAWKNTSAVVLIDAACSGAPPGTIHRFDASARPLPARVFRHSTHSFGVAEAIELGRALNQLPASIILYGIEGASFGPGTGISPAVESGVREAARRILQEVRIPQVI